MEKGVYANQTKYQPVSLKVPGHKSKSVRKPARTPRLWRTLVVKSEEKHENLSCPPQVGHNWRSYRACLVAGEKGQLPKHLGGPWAHELSVPERGCLLVAKRLDMGYFNHTVVLVLEHDDSMGTFGIILNNPLPHSLSKEIDLPASLSDMPCYIGGPVDLQTMTVVHGRCIPGGTEALEGVYYDGNLQESISLGADLTWENVKICMGSSGWRPFQLQAELHDQAGWFVVACSCDVVFGRGTGFHPHDPSYTHLYWKYILQLSNLEEPKYRN